METIHLDDFLDEGVIREEVFRKKVSESIDIATETETVAQEENDTKE